MDAAIVLVAYLVVVNVVAFAVYGVDKKRAERGEPRIPEFALLLLAFLGGAVGALVGMLAFRHKTRKLRFRVCIPIALVLNLAIGGSALFLCTSYHANEVAMDAVEESAASDGVEVRDLGGTAIAFVPESPRAGLIFYPGARVQPESYAPLLRRCAREGVLCVLLKPPFNLAILGVSLDDGIKERFPDVRTWLVAGHSLGGVAAAEYAASHPHDFKGIVFLGAFPQTDLSRSGLASLSIVGSNDGIVRMGNYEGARALLPGDARERVIEGGNHAGFGNYGPQAGDMEATIAPDEQQAIAVEEIISLIDGLA